MEPQRPSQYPFLRMQPFAPSRDTRNGPLPPPPYSAPSSAAHNNPTPVYDPFRNRDGDAQRRTQTPPFSTLVQGANGAEYPRQQYTGSSGKLHGLAHDTHMRHSSYGSGSLFGSNGGSVRGHADGEGKQQHYFRHWKVDLFPFSPTLLDLPTLHDQSVSRNAIAAVVRVSLIQCSIYRADIFKSFCASLRCCFA